MSFMNTKKSHRKIITITVICSVFYIIFALRPLSTELHMTPEWSQDISRKEESHEGDNFIPFRLGQDLGYFTEDGRIVYKTTFPFKASISEKYWTVYGPDNTSALIYNPDGSEKTRLNAAGFPFIDKDNIFVFLPGGNAFAKYDNNGKELWRYESYAPITAFSSAGKASAAGFADGSLVSFNEDGKVDQSFFPGGSGTQVILGTAVSPDGSLLACLSGLNPQRFVLSEKNEGHSKIIFHEYLEKDCARQVLVKFNSNSDTVYYNYQGGLGIVNVKSRKSSHVPLQGKIIQIEESSVEKLVFVLSRNAEKWTVTCLEPFDNIAGNFSFDAEKAFIQVRGNKLFVGKDNKISCLSISRK